MGMRVAWTFMLVVFVVIVQVKCENGGLLDGNKCHCPGNIHGVRCELVQDRVPLGSYINATITVELSVAYSDDLDIAPSGLSLALTELQRHILPAYFQGIEIIHIQSNGPAAYDVIHDVIMRIPFNKSEPVADQYANNYKEVEKILRTTKKCTPGSNPPICIEELKGITPNIPPTEKELCMKTISEFIVSYFDAVVEDEGLSCVSQCDLASPRVVDCNEGTCQIKKDGAECFCPNTDKYLYTYSTCRGAVLIAAMYGGVGAAIAVLVITSTIMGVFFYRKKYYY